MNTSNSKKKLFVNIGIVVLIVAIIAAAIGYVTLRPKANKTDGWYKIDQAKKITIGLDDTFIPMGFRNKQGKLVGFDVDLADKTFKKLGIKVKWEPINWATKEQLLNNGQIDAIWNGYTVSAARKKKVAFSVPYKKGTQVLVTLSKYKMRSFADMQGKTLGVQNASTADTQFSQYKNLLKKYVKSPVEKYDTFDKAFMDLKAGRIQGILVDSMYAGYYIQHLSDSKDYQIITGAYPTDNTAVGFRKSDKLLRQKVNAVLEKFQKNGQMKSLQQKWFGKADSNLK
ncbi:amino acid ABC transporter substrate-binding protein [Oenococcus sicerae]|uniref:amino acid ABC transporter substrate-binding protein n=1 Tax=Oenococcus sicerae TaxID=2203724 RepID=UPI0010B36B51|nr:L-cystine-binding protein FliY {ECO:0000305} precursor [Oenococcus sicerae]